MSIGSLMATILVLAALLFIGVLVLTIKVARHHATKAWVGIAIALPVLLLSLEQFISLGRSYDIVARTSFHPYVPEAPIMGAIWNAVALVRCRHRGLPGCRHRHRHSYLAPRAFPTTRSHPRVSTCRAAVHPSIPAGSARGAGGL